MEREIAEDFLHETFLDIWENRKKIEITTSVSAYLFTIMAHRQFAYLHKAYYKNED